MSERLLSEPDLFFNAGQKNIDPKIGLLNFGPYGTAASDDAAATLRIGVIATKKYILKLQAFLEHLHDRIPGALDKETGTREPDFPGLGIDKPLRFDIVIDKSCVETIEEKDIELLEPLSREQRIVKTFEMYQQKLHDLASADPRPRLVIMPLSQTIISLCKEPELEGDKIVYQRRQFRNTTLIEDVPLFDFHNALKVAAYSEGSFATQFILPATLKFQGTQDEATIAWNFAVAAYYKDTGIPWKLADIDDETCYAGISFFQDLSGGEPLMRASLAQVYLRTGESQVIRGSPFKWNGQGRSPRLSVEHAESIIKDVVELYRRQKGKNPKRVVVHKTAPFTEEEIDGFNRPLTDIEIVDYVHIGEKTGLMVLPDKEKYPCFRGTFIYEETKNAKPEVLLFTTGFVPALQTYKGASVPAPLLLTAYRLDSTPEIIARDVLALTKLDWNSCDFNTRLPVTISVSRKVGAIMSESSADNVTFAQNYRYYM